MAQFYKNFEGDALGEQPSDIARTWDTAGAITVVDLPPKRLAVNQGSFVRRAAYLTVVPQNADLECLASMSVASTAGSIGLMSLRANVGSSTSRTGYVLFVRFDTGVIEIRRAVAGAESALQTLSYAFQEKTLYQVRARVSGVTPVSVYMRIWVAGDPEPGTWGLAYTDNSASRISAAGYAHFGSSGSANNSILFGSVGVGTDGDPAPTGPADPPRQRSRLILTPW